MAIISNDAVVFYYSACIDDRMAADFCTTLNDGAGANKNAVSDCDIVRNNG